jgi:hypothetical protein
MGIDLDVYYVYELETEGCGSRYFCFTAHRPGYSNAIQSEEDTAETQLEMNKNKRLQEAVGSLSSCGGVIKVDMIGCSYELPVGEALYESRSQSLEIWIAEQKYGSPWIILGTADSETEFWEAVSADTDLMACGPKLPAQKLTVSFLG